VSNSGEAGDKTHKISSKGDRDSSNQRAKSVVGKKQIKSENRAREDSIERKQMLELGQARSAKKAKERDEPFVDASDDAIKGSLYSLFCNSLTY